MVEHSIIGPVISRCIMMWHELILMLNILLPLIYKIKKKQCQEDTYMFVHRVPVIIFTSHIKFCSCWSDTLTID